MSNFYDDLEKIKNKALAVNHSLELQKEASVKLSKELAKMEFSETSSAAMRAADVKIDALNKVSSASKGASKSFVDEWKAAFDATRNNASALSDSLSASFSSLSAGSSGQGFLSAASSSDYLKLALRLAQGYFGGAFADGGRPPQNKVSLVGERGPELFVPDSAGTIVPNENLKEQKSTPIVVNQQFTFQSLDPVTNMKMLQAQKAQIQNWVVDGIRSNENGLRNVVEGV